MVTTRINISKFTGHLIVSNLCALFNFTFTNYLFYTKIVSPKYNIYTRINHNHISGDHAENVNPWLKTIIIEVSLYCCKMAQINAYKSCFFQFPCSIKSSQMTSK